jgi:hypothetical protein
VRAEAGDMNRVMRDAQQAIRRVAPDVVFDVEGSRRISELRERHFEGDRVMMGLLGGVIIALLAATALGIVGLASYWVEQRRKQIGIRRALGATRTDVMRYFQVEPADCLHRHRGRGSAGLRDEPDPDALLRTAAPATAVSAGECGDPAAAGPGGGTAAGAACRGHRAGVGHPFVVSPCSSLGRSLLPSASENSHAQDARRQQSVPGGS